MRQRPRSDQICLAIDLCVRISARDQKESRGSSTLSRLIPTTASRDTTSSLPNRGIAASKAATPVSQLAL